MLSVESLCPAGLIPRTAQCTRDHAAQELDGMVERLHAGFRHWARCASSLLCSANFGACSARSAASSTIS
jgi:hypothetical protein